MPFSQVVQIVLCCRKNTQTPSTSFVECKSFPLNVTFSSALPSTARHVHRQTNGSWECQSQTAHINHQHPSHHSLNQNASFARISCPPALERRRWAPGPRASPLATRRAPGRWPRSLKKPRTSPGPSEPSWRWTVSDPPPLPISQRSPRLHVCKNHP